MWTTYNSSMKRLQIYIEPDMDDALALLAVRERTSKAALIRQFVAERLGLADDRHDPLDALVGATDKASGPIDDLIYGR